VLLNRMATVTPPPLASDALNIQADIQTLKASISNALLMGDQIIGIQGSTDVVKQTALRNQELKEKKTALEMDLKKKEAIINRTNRDFSDVKDSLPERFPKRVLQTVEDKTLAVTVVSYVFMMLAFIWWYASQSAVFLTGFGQGVGLSVVITLIVVMVGYYVV